MVETESSFSKIRKIDNRRHLLPFWTSLLIVFLIVLMIWFFKGGSFKLYASIFFLTYTVTQRVWLSVLLIGVIQNIMFIPLRMIGNSFQKSLKDFEEELENTHKEEDQLVVFNERVKQGSLPIVFYIFNFFVNGIAFFSAVRIFLIDFYTDPLKLKTMNLLYDFVPYPKYPLKGTLFKMPLFKVIETTAVDWSTIFIIIGSVILFFIVLRLIWRILRIFLGRNQKILYARIKFNRILLTISGFGSVLLIIFVIFLRNIPISFEYFLFVVDLTVRNVPMNTVTAIGTFITTLHAGYKHNSENAKVAQEANIPKDIVKKVFRDKMKVSFKNAVILGIGAFLITNNIPSAFELSVVTFEIMYIIYPYTFGQIVKRAARPSPVVELPVAESK